MTAPTRRRELPVGPRLEARVRARARRLERRRRRVRRASVVALALVPLCLLSWLLLSSPVLSVHRVEVTGVTRVSADDVRTAAAVPLGTPLARVDTDAARRRVAALATVGRVRVVRAWPRTLRVQVRERTPVANVRQGDGTWALVDATGTRFAPAADAAPGLPELQVSPEQSPESAVQVLAELPVDLRQEVAAVQQPTPSSVVLVLRSGRTVIWGPPGQSARKAAIVAALLPRPGKTIDVTTPALAVVR